MLPRPPPGPLRFWFALPRTTRCIHQQSLETVAETGHIVAAGFLVAAAVGLSKVIQTAEQGTMKNIEVVECMPVQA